MSLVDLINSDPLLWLASRRLIQYGNATEYALLATSKTLCILMVRGLLTVTYVNDSIPEFHHLRSFSADIGQFMPFLSVLNDHAVRSTCSD